MSEIRFFTPVSFGNHSKSWSHSILEVSDSYFFLGNRKASVISMQTENKSIGVKIIKESPPFLTTALKVISYFTLVLPALMLIVKAIMRSIHSFHIYKEKQQEIKKETKEDLAKGIEISQDTVAKIQNLMPKILKRQKDEEIKWLAVMNNLVFKLSSVSNLIFKMVPPNKSLLTQEGKKLSAKQISERRIENMIMARDVCKAHELGLLIIPHAKLFEVEHKGKAITVIAEEHLDIQSESIQEESFLKLPGLNESVRQLTTFIAHTEFSDVEWRNIPIVDIAPEFTGSRRIALIDLEEMGGAETGIYGNYLQMRRGLIRCLFSEKQIDIVLEEARRQGIVDYQNNPKQVKEDRIKEMAPELKLQQFYKRKGITKDNCKPIQVDDLNSLGLDPNEKGNYEHLDSALDEFTRVPITLGEVTAIIIREINNALKKSPEGVSLKRKRNITLDFGMKKELNKYYWIGMPEGVVLRTVEQDRQSWVYRIIAALVEKGHLFKMHNDSAEFYIQA